VGFSELMADSDPFRPSAENEWRRRVALGNELARIVSSAEEVESARVIIQDKSKRRLGVSNIKPTASVFVKMARGKVLTQSKVEALCRLVSGATAGLKAHEVTVVDADTMRAYAAPDPEDAMGIGLLEERKKNEGHLAAKIMAALQSIPGVLVSVSVELDSSKSRTQRATYDKQGVKTDESGSTSTESASGAGETGVNPNVGVALSANPGGSRSETEDSKTEFYPKQPTEIVSEEKIPFGIRRATASIGIPRGFLVGIYRARFGESDDPATLDDNDNFRAVKQVELDRVRSAVMNILMTKDESDVDVDVFYDFAEGGTELNAFAGAAPAASVETGAMDYLRSYGMQGGLVVLALISFLTMTRMVRKSSELARKLHLQQGLLGDEESGQPPRVDGGPVGSVAAGEGLLVGQEVDDDTLRFSQLGDQVSRMVEANPQLAADLIRRWTQSSDQ